jgi:hypothetical protein
VNQPLSQAIAEAEIQMSEVSALFRGTGPTATFKESVRQLGDLYDTLRELSGA